MSEETTHRDYGTIEAACAAWNDNKPVWTIEMGGIGPGYEQVIQLGIWNLCTRAIIQLEKTGEKRGIYAGANWDYLENTLHDLVKSVDGLDGMSGAQAGAAIKIAQRFLNSGYSETLNEVGDDRRILCSREWPQNSARQESESGKSGGTATDAAPASSDPSAEG